MVDTRTASRTGRVCSKCKTRKLYSAFYCPKSFTLGRICAECKAEHQTMKVRFGKVKAFPAGPSIFYVYGHISSEGTIMYVGKGKYCRAWNVKSRTPEHQAWLMDQYNKGRGPLEIVSLFNQGLSEEDALEAERHLIKKWSPMFNRQARRNLD